MRRLKLVSVLVSDQDEAIRFYTQKLGFEVVEDAAFGGGRWVTLSIPGNRDVALSLNRATSAEDRALVGRQGGSTPLLGIDTDDCMADWRRMKALGVKFDGEPQSGPWGVGVTIRDLHGNGLFLSQEPA